MFLGIRFFQIW